MNDYLPKVKIVRGKKRGKIVAVFSGIHGNERAGVLAVKELMKEIKIDAGTLYLVIANPLALEKNKRFLEKNLNRRFLKGNKGRALEDKIARKLMKILDDCDALLDLHAFSDPKGKPFAICGTGDSKLASIFDVDLISYGWNDLEPGATDGYMENLKKPAVCLECGPIPKAEEYKDFAKRQVLKFLTHFGLKDGRKPEAKIKKIIRVFRVFKAETNNFTFSKEYRNFEMLPAGRVFATDGEKKIRARKNECIIFPRKNQAIGAEACLLGKIVKK